MERLYIHVHVIMCISLMYFIRFGRLHVHIHMCHLKLTLLVDCSKNMWARANT